LRRCEEYHRCFDQLANGEIQTQELPSELHVRGKIAWWIYRGSHDGMGEAWGVFGGKVRDAVGVEETGPPGDIYLCDPKDHPGAWEEMLTVLWAPRK
jgi:hypothetical protein